MSRALHDQRPEALIGSWPEYQLDEGFEDAELDWRLSGARGEPG